jgi:hypothetical protein
MPTIVIHDWDISERKAEVSESRVFVVYRLVHPRGGVPRTEYMRSKERRTTLERRQASKFRSRDAAERAIARAAQWAMNSKRFERPVIVTRHAAQRMTERGISDALLLRLIDEGQTRYTDEVRLWAWLDVPERSDNLLCTALVLEHAVIVKTVMTNWELMP